MNKLEIDLDARRKAAEVYRHFASGSLTNDQMEDALPKSSESGLHEIFAWGIWPLFDDLHEHKLTGRYRLTQEGRDHVARIILFLNNSFPYRWPIAGAWRGFFEVVASIFTLGRLNLARRRLRSSGGEDSVWPFFTRAEYESALAHPPYLCGAKCA